MSKISFCILFFLSFIAFPYPLLAGVQVDHADVFRMTQKLDELYALGIDIHKKYDFNNIPDVQECVDKYGALRGEGKILQESAEQIPAFFYRSKLKQGAADVFSCVYCGGSGTDCRYVAEAIEDIRQMLKDDGYKPE